MGGATTRCARIIALRCRPEDLDTLLSIYRSSSVPMVANRPGILLVAGVASAETGYASSVTVWETPEDREAGGISVESAANLSQYAPLMVGSYVRDAYDAPVFRVERLPRGGADGTLTARVTTEDVEPEQWDAAVASLTDLANALVDEGGAGYGAMLFVSQQMSRALLIEFAQRPSTFDRLARLLRQHRREAREQGLLRLLPRTETFDTVDIW